MLLDYKQICPSQSSIRVHSLKVTTVQQRLIHTPCDNGDSDHNSHFTDTGMILRPCAENAIENVCTLHCSKLQQLQISGGCVAIVIIKNFLCNNDSGLCLTL